MGTAEELRKETDDSKEIQEELKAVPDGMPEGELDDDGAGEVSGGFAFVPVQIPPAPPVTPV